MSYAEKNNTFQAYVKSEYRNKFKEMLKDFRKNRPTESFSEFMVIALIEKYDKEKIE